MTKTELATSEDIIWAENADEAKGALSKAVSSAARGAPFSGVMLPAGGYKPAGRTFTSPRGPPKPFPAGFAASQRRMPGTAQRTPMRVP